MAIKNRNGRLYIDFYPFQGKRVGVQVDVRTKSEARLIEGLIKRACRTGDYWSLDSTAREACVRMFHNQRWELPPDLAGDHQLAPQEELTLEKATELFLNYPKIVEYGGRWRYRYALDNLKRIFKKDLRVKDLRIPHLKRYQLERRKEGVAPATVNRELSVLSRLFEVLKEQDLLEKNPVRDLKRLSVKGYEREAYLAFEDVERIVESCPEWSRPIMWTGYYAGMRRGEILGLTRRQVNLTRRIITLGASDTKEGRSKRVPVHRDLAPILAQAMQGPSLINGKLFALQDTKGIREIELETFKNLWPRACEKLRLEKPWPRFHDLRHTWRANARRSGVDPFIAETIMGHWNRGKSVNERYGYISDGELVHAIDKMTVRHGPTMIQVAGR